MSSRRFVAGLAPVLLAAVGSTAVLLTTVTTPAEARPARARRAHVTTPSPVTVLVIDHDTEEPLSARVIVADGAHPDRVLQTIDSGRGPTRLEVADTALRITATRGPEYTVDTVETQARKGEPQTVTLRLRRVVDTPGWAACDFHVHGHGSFDSHLSEETRVRSLVAAGIDFAAPTEHDTVGSYQQGVSTSGLRLAWAPSVEVTRRELGHFNVLGFAGTSSPWKGKSDIDTVLDRIRKESPDSLVQVNHPRFGSGMGFFNLLRLDAHTGRGVDKLPRALDAIEVYNGMDLRHPRSVDAMVSEWLALFERGATLWATGGSDAHHEGGIPPGYPRTYVQVSGDDDGQSAASLSAGDVVSGARAGRSFVTSGPLVEVRQAGRGPGGELSSTDGVARVEITVRAAPWVDVTSVEVMVGGVVAWKRELPHRATETGAPIGSLADARKAAIRFQETVDVPIAAGARSLVVVARGERSAADAVPGLDFVPYGFSNPMVVRR